LAAASSHQRGSTVHRRVAGLHTQSSLSPVLPQRRRRPLQWSRTETHLRPSSLGKKLSVPSTLGIVDGEQGRTKW
jgi:hypothetical protein